MSDSPIITSNNLVDLTIEPSSPDMMSMEPIFPPMESMIVAHTGRLSIENNPFDHLQKLAERFDDPFEIVQTQADRNIAVKTESRNVLTESLIVIEDSPQKSNRQHDTNSFDDADNSVFYDNLLSVPKYSKGKCRNIRSDTIGKMSSISVNSTALTDSEITVNKGFEIETSIKCELEPSQTKVFDLNNGFMDNVRSNRIHSDPAAVHHKVKLGEAANKGRSSSFGMLQQKPNQLLKLSLKNSSFGSPKERAAAKLMTNSPNGLSDSSLLADETFDDLMATSMNLIDSDGDINPEVDHVNHELIVAEPTKLSPSPEKLPIHQATDRLTLIESLEKCKQKMNESKLHMEKSPPDLEALVEFAEVSPIKSHGDSHISALLGMLKQEIEQSKSVEINVKANAMLDGLNNLLGQKPLPSAPSPIVRQATFNIAHEYYNQQQQDAADLSPITSASESGITVAASVSSQTPMRSNPSTRRSSFSHSNDQNTSTRLVRRSIYAAPKPILPGRKSLQPKRRSTPPKETTTPFTLPPKPSTGRHTTTKLKVRVQEMAKSCSSNGPMRALIPINKLAPYIAKPSLLSPTETGSMTTSTPRNLVASSTPMHRKQSLGASPPMTPIRRSSQVDLPNNGRVRFGNLSATPNPKSTGAMLGTLGRRRSLSEFKTASKSIPTASDSKKLSVSKKTVGFIFNFRF